MCIGQPSTFEQVIRGFPAVGASSDTGTVATNSLPDGIKYNFSGIFFYLFIFSIYLQYEHSLQFKTSTTYNIIFTLLTILTLILRYHILPQIRGI